MIYLVIAVGVLYFLGAYLMYAIADEDDPHDMKVRTLYSVFWPGIVAGGLIEKLMGVDD